MIFNPHVNRKNGPSVKWDIARVAGDDRMLPMTIADMDIATPDFVLEAMRSVLDDQVLGYVAPSHDFYQAFIHWEAVRHSVQLTRDQIILASGVVPAMAFAIRHLTATNDRIVVMAPYYTPYEKIVTGNHRQFVAFPLKEIDGQYAINFEALEDVLAVANTAAMVICNPHNPSGRVWTLPELQRLQSLANKYNILVLDDEIHDDTTLPQNYPISMLSKLMAPDKVAKTVMFKAPTKAFNMAGSKVSFMVTCHPELLATLKDAAAAEAFEELNTMGLVGAQAAYERGAEWLDAVNGYLAENCEHLVTALKETTRIVPMRPEATYLAWLDFRAYGLSEDQLIDELMGQDQLVLNAGSSYGDEGLGFMRLNFAVDRSVLDQAIERLQAFDQRHQGA